MSVEQSFRRTGRILQENDEDFQVEIVKWHKKNGRKKTAVLKTVQNTIHDRRRDGFLNESLGTEVFRKLARQHPAWALVVPRTYAEGDDWSIRRFMKGRPILEEGAEFDNIDTTHKHLGQLANLLTQIDRVEPDLSIPDDPRNSAPYDAMLIRTPEWAAKAIEAGLLNSDDYAAVEELTAANQPFLVPRYAHGDLMPYAHVFARPDGRLAFIDFEHFSAHKPRYYDVAYCYAQLYTKPENPSLAQYFMKRTLETAEPTEYQTEQLTTVLAQRAVRLFFDSAFEGRERDHHYVQKTQQLLEISLAGDSSALTEPAS